MQQFNLWFELGMDIWTLILDFCSIGDELSARKTCKFLNSCSIRSFVKRRSPWVLGRKSESEEDDLRLMKAWLPFRKYFTWKTFTTEIEDRAILDCDDLQHCVSGNVLITHTRTLYTEQSMIVNISAFTNSRGRRLRFMNTATFQECAFEVHSYDSVDHSMLCYDPLFFNTVSENSFHPTNTEMFPCLTDVLVFTMIKNPSPKLYFRFTISQRVIDVRVPISDYVNMCKIFCDKKRTFS